MSQTKPPASEQRTRELLDAARAAAPQTLIHSIAVSVASFIAEVDSSSSRVADYIERRLSPLAHFVNVDERVRLALESIAQDARSPEPSPAPPEQPARGDGVRLVKRAVASGRFVDVVTYDDGVSPIGGRLLFHTPGAARVCAKLLNEAVLDDAPGKDGAK